MWHRWLGQLQYLYVLVLVLLSFVVLVFMCLSSKGETEAHVERERERERGQGGRQSKSGRGKSFPVIGFARGTRACKYIYSSLHVSRVPTCDGLHYTISAGARSNGGKAEDALRGRPTPLTQGLAAVAVSPKCVTGPARRTQGTSSAPWVAPPAPRSRVRTPLHAVGLCGLGVGVRRPYVERYKYGHQCGHHANARWQERQCLLAARPSVCVGV